MRRVEAMNARVRSEEQRVRLFAGGWPAFIGADREAERYMGPVRERFGDLELVVLDNGVMVAAGWAVPIAWSGEPRRLPAGYADSLARAVDGDGDANTLVVMAAQVHPERRGRGLAGELLAALCDLAAERRWPRVVAPVRPTLKARYPLTPIRRFARWKRADGSPLDPWMRTHWRLGAKIIGIAPRSQTMTGTVAEWEGWTGMVFPESGRYVVPGGLAPLHVEHGADRGVCVEPNVWFRHR